MACISKMTLTHSIMVSIPQLILLFFLTLGHSSTTALSITHTSDSNSLKPSLSPGVMVGKRANDISELGSLGNNTLFDKWRPRFHFLAPAGWINDPCGAMYDPTRDLYHLMYQWNPNHVMWGNISWGHAVSRDLITWTDIRDWRDASSQALVGNPEGTQYDKLGIFSGTAQPVNLQGEQDGTLTIFYTGVSALPTNWRLPYIPGTEKQAFAISKDGGETWERYEGNPVLAEPPEGWNITGWRDPFFEPYPELDRLLNQSQPHYYMVLGSGIKDVGPRIPLYSAPANDLTNWTFLGSLWEPSLNESFSEIELTGSQGFNFEVSGFYPLEEPINGKPRHFTNFGAEGGSILGHNRWSLWSEGRISARENGSVEFETIAAGVSDWGNLYALTSFLDTKHYNRRVQWGWTEDEFNGYLPLARAVGYNGAMGLPRELFIKTIDGVVDTEDGYLSKKGPFVVEVNECKNLGNNTQGKAKQTLTVSTQGLRPLPELVRALRKSAKQEYTFPCGARKTGMEYLRTNSHPNNNNTSQPIQSNHFSLRATITHISNSISTVGFVVLSSPNGEEQTKITYSPHTHRIEIHREKSSLISDIVGNYTVWGHFRPLILADNSSRNKQAEKEEEIHFEIFVDGSLIEVFVNERWAATTRVYPWREDSLGVGIYVEKKFELGGEEENSAVVIMEDIKLWTGLGENVDDHPYQDNKDEVEKGTGWLVWPKRPRNSSSELIWDGPEETGNGTWWVGF